MVQRQGKFWMPRIRPPARPVFALAAATALPGILGGCHYASSPFVGFPGFIADTHTFRSNPNLPPGSDETLLHSEGRDVAMEPLLTEPGNVWPGPAPLDPTLADVQRLQNQQEQPLNPQAPQAVPTNPAEPRPVPRGSSTPPGAVQTVPSVPPPPAPRGQLSAPPAATAPLPPPVIPTPSGPLINNGPVGVPGGMSTGTDIHGGQDIIVPNGNGTSTVISPDGSVRIIPSPK